MGTVKRSPPAKLFCGVLSARAETFLRVEAELVRLFGPVDLASAILPFTYTTYYDRELGTPVQRQFLFFAKLIDQGQLPHIKLSTNALEQELSHQGSRTANLDPGYLTAAKVVLATTKDYGHRLYLGDGIFGEVTLHYRSGQWAPWPWTYPDYSSSEYQSIFLQARGIYLDQLRIHRHS